MNMKRKRTESQEKISVTITKSDHQYILDKTLVEAEAFGLGRVKGDGITFKLSCEEIEYIQDYIAAEANYSKSKRVEKKLDRLFDLLESYRGE
jgi:hypothetical protein